MKRFFPVSLVFLALLAGCNSRPEIDTDNLMNEIETEETTSEIKSEAEFDIQVDPAEINSIINSIPSPLEIAFLIKEQGGEYNMEYLNATENQDKYDNSYSKALNLGIYGADLAYTNIYSKSTDGREYLGAVRGLAEDLNIDKFFDIATLTRLLKNNSNMDSLLVITTSNFERINVYLQDNNRSHLSTLLLTGGWLEGLHLICEVYEYNPNDQLKERIGEQKIVLEQLLHLLSYYESNAEIKALADDLKELNEVFKKVNIETVEGETSIEMIDGIPMAVSESYTKVTISPEQVKEITELNKKIRNSIIN